MNYVNQNRVLAGSPEGGEWAPGQRSETPQLSLDSHECEGADAAVAIMEEVHGTQHDAQHIVESWNDRDDFEKFVSQPGARFRASTRAAMDSGDAQHARGLIMRDVHYHGQEDRLRSVVSESMVSAPSSEATYRVEPSDYSDIYNEPSPELVEALHRAPTDGTYDDRIAAMVHGQASWNSARRKYGQANRDSVLEGLQHTIREPAPGMLTSASHKGKGQVDYHLSEARNAEIPADHRAPNGRYTAGPQAAVVEQTFAAELSDRALYDSRAS